MKPPKTINTTTSACAYPHPAPPAQVYAFPCFSPSIVFSPPKYTSPKQDMFTNTHRFVKIQNDVTTVLFQTTYCTPRPTITTPRNGFKAWSIPTTHAFASPFEKTEKCNKKWRHICLHFRMFLFFLHYYVLW